jgi:hypothetical protein
MKYGELKRDLKYMINAFAVTSYIKNKTRKYSKL